MASMKKIGLPRRAELGEIVRHKAVQAFGARRRIVFQHVPQRGEHVGNIPQHDDGLDAERRQQISIGGKCLHVNMRDDLGEILVEIGGDKIGKIGRSIPAALGVNQPKHSPADGMRRRLTKNVPAAFGAKASSKTDRDVPTRFR